MRGTGVKVKFIYYDEADFFKPEDYAVTLPLLAANCAMVMTTSVAPGNRSVASLIEDSTYADGIPAFALGLG